VFDLTDLELTIALTVYQIAVTLGFSIGFLWGEAFSGFDGEVTHGDNGFDTWPRWKKFIVGALLDANHHFQYGLVIMLIAMLRPDIWIFKFSWLNVHPTINLILLWLGWGMVVSDWKDYKNVLKRMTPGQEEEEEDDKDG